MAEAKVFFVHLRRPASKSKNPKEQRDDPYYEFGSFGCTGCHRSNLFNPRHADELEGSRLAFVQGGRFGSRLVYLTPPISVVVWKNHCEARWKPAEMPFKYADAPVLAHNDGDSDFPLIEQFARATRCLTVESGLSSRLRSRTLPLPAKLAKEVVAVYEEKLATASRSAFAKSYDEALPHAPPKIDRNRKVSYRNRIQQLRDEAAGTNRVSSSKTPRKTRNQSCCGQTGRRRSGC